MDMIDEKVGSFFTQLKGYGLWKSKCQHIDLDKLEMKDWVIAVHELEDFPPLSSTVLLRMDEEWQKHIYGISIDSIQQRHDDVAADTINPNYYTDMEITPREFIVANDMDWDAGNVIKYVCRWRNKNGLEDLKKARRYLDFLIEQAEEQ